jgi:hypothetical protein
MYKESYNTLNFSKNMEHELLEIPLPSNEKLLNAIEKLKSTKDENLIENQAFQSNKYKLE